MRLVRRSQLVGLVSIRSLLALAASSCALIWAGCGAEPGSDENALGRDPEPLGNVNVLTRGFNNQRTHANLLETVLKPSNVNDRQFGKLFQLAVDDEVYAQVLYASAVAISGVTRNVVYAATVNNTVYAFDADSGATLWQKNFNGSGRTARIQDTPELSNCYNTTENIGIVGTPVIDGASSTLYFVTHTIQSSGHVYALHAVDITTGNPRTGSPRVIDGSVTGSGIGGDGSGNIRFNPVYANQRPGLALSQGVVYVAFASFCDQGPYHGWLMGYDSTTLSRTALVNVTPDGDRGGIWLGGAAPAFDSAGNLYITTGNGAFDGSRNFGETLLKLAPRTLARLDYFTPSNYADLNSIDQDFGSAGPTLLPGQNLLVNGGKEGRIYVVDGSNMGHMVSGDTQIPQRFQAVSSAPRPSGTHHIHNGVAAWNSPSGLNMYVWGENDYLRLYRFNASTKRFDTTPAAVGSVLPPAGMPGGMMSLSANGSLAGTGVLWATTQSTGDANNFTVPGVLRAFNAENLALLWESRSPGDDALALAKYNPPVVANGKVYVPSFSKAISVYGPRSGPTPPINGGVYQVRTGTGEGLCVDVSGGSLSDAARIQQYACNGSDAQRWRIVNIADNVYELRGIASGKCLDVSGGSASSGAAIQQYTCNGTAAQHWALQALGGGLYRLMPQTGASLCLDVAGGSASSGALLQQYACNGSAAQSFTLAIDDRGAQPVPNGTYRVRTDTAPGKCVDALRALGRVGDLQQLACNGGDSQRLRFTNVGTNLYEIRTALNERCMDVSGASAANGAIVQQYTCNSGPAQQWALQAAGAGKYRLLAQTGTARCLDVEGASTQDGAGLQQWDCNGSDAQDFSITAP